MALISFVGVKVAILQHNTRKEKQNIKTWYIIPLIELPHKRHSNTSIYISYESLGSSHFFNFGGILLGCLDTLDLVKFNLV